MCNACGFLCCAYDGFSGCGCDGCPNSDCWSDDNDFDDGDYDPFDGIRARAHRFVCDSPTVLQLPSREAASPRRSIAVMGTDRAASASASCPSYQLAPGDPASVEGGERGRSFARTAGSFQGRAA